MKKTILSMLTIFTLMLSFAIPVSATPATATEYQDIFQEDMQEFESKLESHISAHKNQLFSDTFEFTTNNGNTMTVSYGTSRVGVVPYDDGEGVTYIDEPGDYYTWFDVDDIFLGSGSIEGQLDWRVTDIISGVCQLEAKSTDIRSEAPQGFKQEDEEFDITENRDYWLRAEGNVSFTQDAIGYTLNYYPDIQILADTSPQYGVEWYWSC